MEQQTQIKRNVLPRNIETGVIAPYVKYLFDNSYSHGTVKQYLSCIERLIKSTPTKSDISPQKIKSFLNNKTYLTNQGAVKSFIEFLKEELHVEIDDFKYPKIKVEEKVIIPLSQDEIQILINNMPDDDSGLFFQFKLFTEFLSKTGVRISEAVSLKIGNISFREWDKDRSKNGRILLVHTKNNRERLIPISSDMMKKLSIHSDVGDGFRREPDEYIFDFNYKGFIKRCNRRKKKAEQKGETFRDEKYWDLYYVDKSKKYYGMILAEISEKHLKKHVKAHLFRHTYASFLDSKNIRPAIIQRLLGHKNISTTSMYLHPSREEMDVGIIN